MKIKHVKILRIISFIIFILFMISIIYFLFPTLKGITSLEGRIIAKEKLSSFGFFSMVIIIIIEALKVFTIMLPGEPIELLSGMCFGPVKGLIVVYIGIIISTYIISILVKKIGVELVKSLVSKEKYEKVNELIEKNPGKVENILFLLYFIPLVPKDFVTYFGSLVPISNKKFLSISLIARFPAVFSSTLIGSLLLDGKFWEVIFVYLITYSITGIFIYIYKYNMKKVDGNKNKIVNDK